MTIMNTPRLTDWDGNRPVNVAADNIYKHTRSEVLMRPVYEAYLNHGLDSPRYSVENNGVDETGNLITYEEAKQRNIKFSGSDYITTDLLTGKKTRDEAKVHTMCYKFATPKEKAVQMVLNNIHDCMLIIQEQGFWNFGKEQCDWIKNNISVGVSDGGGGTYIGHRMYYSDAPKNLFVFTPWNDSAKAVLKTVLDQAFTCKWPDWHKDIMRRKGLTSLQFYKLD